MEDFAYAAGVIDGEGTITLAYRHSTETYRRPVVSVSSTTRELLDFLQQTFKGTIVSHKTYQSHHKPNWSWRLVDIKAIQFVSNVLPYLKVPEKIYRARMLYRYRDVTVRNGKYTSEQHAAKLQFEHDFFHPSTS